VVHGQWPILFLLSDSILTLGSGSKGQKERGERGSPVRWDSIEGALEVDDSELLVVSGKKEGMDEVKQITARLRVWSAPSIASCRDEKGRMEVVQGVGGVG
jgi:hypothetical protein